MKKILLFIIALVSMGTAAWAQDPQAYTLDLQNGSFLLKQDGKVIVTPDKEESMFIIKADSLSVDTIIVSKTNQTSKDFTVKLSGKEVMKATITKNIHVGEKGFSDSLKLVEGDYEIFWGSDKWEVKLQPMKEEYKEEEEEESEEHGEDSEAAAETCQEEPENTEDNPWKTAFFILLGVVALLLLGKIKYIHRQLKQLSRCLKRLLGKKAIFIVSGNVANLNLRAYARQNKRKVKYEDECLTLKRNEICMVINVGDTTVKGNQLKITLKDSNKKISTAIYYRGENNTTLPAEGRAEGNVVFYKIDSEQAVKEIVIYPEVNAQQLLSITSLKVETVEKPEDKPKEEPKQPQPVEEPKEEPLMSRVFQETLMGIFNGSDEYKNLDEGARAIKLQQDIESARNYTSEQQSYLNREKDARDEERRDIRDNIQSWIKQNNYIRPLYERIKDKSKEKDALEILKMLLTDNIIEPKSNNNLSSPLNLRLEKKNIDDTTAVKRFVMKEYIIPLQLAGLNTRSFSEFTDSLKQAFTHKEEERQPKEEPRDKVKELVEAVNMKLPDDKKLNADGDVEAQLKTRLSLPTNFDEAERKVWNAVAKALGIDMVDADTLEDAINTKVQGKVEKQLEEKQAVKDVEIRQLLAKAEQQALEKVKSELSGTIANVNKCKNVLEVVQKVRSTISGAQQREKNALAKVREAYWNVVGQNLPEETGLKEAIKRFKEDVPKSVSQQEWEKVGDAITSLGFAEVTNVSEATLSSALGNYYQGRLQKEVTSQLNHLKADPSDAASVLNELNHALDMTNEAEILCSKNGTKTITELKEKLVAETTAMKQQKEEVETQKAAVEKESLQRAKVISTTVDTLRQQLTNGTEELDKLINKAGYMKSISSDDPDSEEVANHNQEAIIEQYDRLQKELLAALPKDSKDLTPAEARARVQKVLENDLYKAFDNKDFSQFSVIDKVARYYAYSRLSFMTENGQEADETGSLRSYGVAFNRSKMTAIFTQMNQLLTDFGLQLIVPTLFAERLGEGHYQRSTSDGDLAILCPHPEYWKQTISNSDKKDIIIDIAATGYYKNGKLVKETEILINNN